MKALLSREWFETPWVFNFQRTAPHNSSTKKFSMNRLNVLKMCGAAAGAAGVVALGAYAYSRYSRYSRYQQTAGAARPKLWMQVYTDMEPDDMLALGVLQLRGYTHNKVIAGEGNAFERQNRVTDLVHRCLGPYTKEGGIHWASSHPGYDSKTLGPGEKPPTSDRYAETGADAKGSASLWLVDLHERRRLTGTGCSVYTDHAMNPVIFCLKPPREILAMMEHHPERARELFAHTTLVMYGSHNLRVLGYDKSLPLVQEDRTPFKKVYLYETYANRDVPNLNPSTVPNMAAWFAHLPEFREALRDYQLKWDNHILQDCRVTMEKEVAAGRGDSPRYMRNKKCLEDVQRNLGNQFVPADAVLALLLDNKEFEPYLQAVRVEHDGDNSHYPTAHYRPVDAAAKVVTWVGLPGDKVVAELTRVCTSAPEVPGGAGGAVASAPFFAPS